VSVVIGPGIEHDPRLLNTGPSPFGWHRYETALRCLAAYGYGLEARLLGRRIDRPQLVRGTLVHLGLAHHYARKLAAQRGEKCDLYAPVEAMERLTRLEIAAGGFAPLWQEQLANAVVAVAGYIAHYATERWRVLHVEEVFGLRFGEAQITQRFDLVVEIDGWVYTVDHKTSAKITADHRRFYALSGQFIGMTWIGKYTWGDRFGGPILNLVEVNGSGKPRFQRPALELLPAQVAAFGATVATTFARMRDAAQYPVDQWPKSPSEHTCWTRYGACDHIERCGVKAPSVTLPATAVLGPDGERSLLPAA